MSAVTKNRRAADRLAQMMNEPIVVPKKKRLKVRCAVADCRAEMTVLYVPQKNVPSIQFTCSSCGTKLSATPPPMTNPTRQEGVSPDGPDPSTAGP